MMNLPGFTAESSLGRATRTYRRIYVYGSFAQSENGLPAGILATQIGDMEDEEIDVEDVEVEEEVEEV